jgi:mRNA interferase MazF
MPTRTFERGDIVRVPFPYTDRDARQHRPALVVSRGGIRDRASLLWVVMITSASNRGWPGDVPLAEGYREMGLPVASTIRTAKIATIDAAYADGIGKVNAGLRERVASVLREHLGGDEGEATDRSGTSARPDEDDAARGADGREPGGK